MHNILPRLVYTVWLATHCMFKSYLFDSTKVHTWELKNAIGCVEFCITNTAIHGSINTIHIRSFLHYYKSIQMHMFLTCIYYQQCEYELKFRYFSFKKKIYTLYIHDIYLLLSSVIGLVRCTKIPLGNKVGAKLIFPFSQMRNVCSLPSLTLCVVSNAGRRNAGMWVPL